MRSQCIKDHNTVYGTMMKLGHVTHRVVGLPARQPLLVLPAHTNSCKARSSDRAKLVRTRYRESQVEHGGQEQPAFLQVPAEEASAGSPQDVLTEEAKPAETLHRAPAQPQNATLKVIGVGARGINSANKLADQADSGLSMAEFWAMESDKKALSSVSPAVRILELPRGEDVGLMPDHLATILGEGHVAPAPGQPDGVAGAVFVLGSAAGSPGGAPLMLQLVTHLRRQGCFVTVALTRPFGFEGARKLEQADALVEAMQEVAHMVVVVDQGVLSRACPTLTMAMASTIADTHLQYVVRSVMWAVRAPELLKITAGAPLWHGRDLRVMKRPLFPPMMSLLSCPGHAYLGCGQAVLPVRAAHSVGLADMLTSLAEQATHDALASPFLLNRMPAATAVLCVLIFPHNMLEVLQPDAGQEPAAASRGLTTPAGTNTYQDSCEYAVRAAVQRSGEVLHQLAGAGCKDVVVCPKGHEGEDQLLMDPMTFTSTTQPDAAPHSDSSPAQLVRVQCALLVLNVMEDGPAEASPSDTSSKTAATSRLGLGQQQGATRRQDSQQQQPPQVKAAFTPPPVVAPAAAVQQEPPTLSFLLARGGKRSRRSDADGRSGTSTSNSPTSPSMDEAEEPAASRTTSSPAQPEPVVQLPSRRAVEAARTREAQVTAQKQQQQAAATAAKRSPGLQPTSSAASSWKRPSNSSTNSTTGSTQIASTIAQRLYQLDASGSDGEDLEDEQVDASGRRPEIDELVTSIRNRSASRSPGAWQEEEDGPDVRTRTEGMLQKERDFS